MTDTTDTTYNGWKNYPTWAVNLWLSNSYELYIAIGEMAHEYANRTESESEYWTIEESNLYSFTDALKNLVTDPESGICPDLGATMASDLLGYAFDCVDWHEIADHLFADARERAEYDAAE